MSLKFVIDMNLSPDWKPFLSANGFQSEHWSAVGDPRASDIEIMAWSNNNNYVVLTHDLDFGTLLAITHASGPSVLQIRAQDVLPDHLWPILLAALRQHENDLIKGALVVVDEASCRVRVLQF